MLEGHGTETIVRNRPLLQMVVIGVIAMRDRDPGRAVDPVVPGRRLIQAHNIHTLYDVLLIASVPIFVLVETVVLYSVWKFRMKPGRGGEGRAADPRQHAARGRLDRAAGDPDRRPVHLRLHGPALQRGQPRRAR